MVLLRWRHCRICSRPDSDTMGWAFHFGFNKVNQFIVMYCTRISFIVMMRRCAPQCSTSTERRGKPSSPFADDETSGVDDPFASACDALDDEREWSSAVDVGGSRLAVSEFGACGVFFLAAAW